MKAAATPKKIMLESDPHSKEETLKDPGLTQLRGQIKNVMIPLLIKVFQLRSELQQTAAPPSRLESSKPKMPLEDLIAQLHRLEEDLKLLHIWNQSCQTQIQKVLKEAKETSTFSFASCIQKECKTNPAVQKSFEGALLSKPSSSSTVSLWKRLLRKCLSFSRSVSS